ncbi:MAG TPA: GspH/FimT family pseudopilin [Burkholderiales bacterium]|nr:GspH/FimT family pseudopilin [Burkholderiales bacterium]
MTSARGFTLVELVVMLVILGVLAVIAIPKFGGVASFNTMGFADRVQAGLRYAQKQAIAKRRNVCVAFTSTKLTFTYAATAGTGVACSAALTGPAGQSAFTIAPESGSTVTLSPVPAGLAFDALGRPIASATGVALTSAVTITIVGDSTRTLTVEPDTGHVHA